FGQYKYDLTKKEKEAKRRQRSVTFKEVRLSPKIGIGDFDTKVNRAVEFLSDGDRIKVTVRFRGRELTHPELGRNLIAKFTEQVKDHGIAERTPVLEGKSMFITMASTHKPKVMDAPVKPGRETTNGETAAPPTVATNVAPEAEGPSVETAAATPPKAKATAARSAGTPSRPPSAAKAPSTPAIQSAQPAEEPAISADEPATPAETPATTGE
ncbi:MAG: translation initiation factor IF-3, partial [Chloroflexota bacterium]